MDSIVLFKGSKRDFNELLKSRDIEGYTPFMELLLYRSPYTVNKSLL